MIIFEETNAQATRKLGVEPGRKKQQSGTKKGGRLPGRRARNVSPSIKVPL
jgi:hypothetical protein